MSRSFSIWLTGRGDIGESELSLGGYPPERMSSSILWLPLSPKATAAGGTGMWQVSFVGATARATRIPGCEGCEAVLDTGTGVIAGPDSFISSVKALLNVQDDCSNYDSLPLIGFTFGHATLYLEPADYVVHSAHGCFDQFLSLDLAPPKAQLVLLGSPFLRRYFTIYDPEALRVGMALATHVNMSMLYNETAEQTVSRLMHGIDRR